LWKKPNARLNPIGKIPCVANGYPKTAVCRAGRKPATKRVCRGLIRV
jgi:hypothetical protein